MIDVVSCAHCGHLFNSDPRVKNQRYCGEKNCQRARKRRWQKEKLATDPDYKSNQLACQIEWHRQHPGYYKKYRQDHPRYCQRNTILQTCRNAKLRVIAKMDASAQKVLIVPIDYEPPKVIAKEYSIAPSDAAC